MKCLQFLLILMLFLLNGCVSHSEETARTTIRAAHSIDIIDEQNMTIPYEEEVAVEIKEVVVDDMAAAGKADESIVDGVHHANEADEAHGGNEISEPNVNEMNEELDVSADLFATEPLVPKRMALTFDDGPHEEITPLILSILKKYGAKATFFMLGGRVAKYPEIVQQVVSDGHEIGNHTWDHPDLTELGSEAIISQLQQTSDQLEAVAGITPTLIRPPYGNYNDTVRASAPGPLINWSVDTLDWRDRDADMIIEQFERQIHDEAIVLMHDVFPSTAEAVERIVAEYSELGYSFVTVSELLEFDQAEPVNGKVYTNKPSKQ